ncbi:MAG: hypothetical protein ACLTDC_10445 [Lachnospiraceae bacterium]
MNSKQIEYFLEVARQGNFTKAAQLLLYCSTGIESANCEFRGGTGCHVI